MFRLGFNLRRAVAKFGRLFLRQFVFGDEFRRSKYFIEKRASGLDHRLQNIIVQLTHKNVFLPCC